MEKAKIIKNGNTNLENIEVKPLPLVEDESQEEMQDAFFELVDIIKEYLENRINAANCASQLKSKYLITRK